MAILTRPTQALVYAALLTHSVLATTITNTCLPGPFTRPDQVPCLGDPSLLPHIARGSAALSTSHPPWTHIPFCPDQTDYCVFTHNAFHQWGVSILGIPAAKAKTVNETSSIPFVESLFLSNPGLITKKLEQKDPPFEIIDIPNKGKGVIATRNIKRGTVIMVDQAVMLVETVFPQKVTRPLGREMLNEGMARLSEEGSEVARALARSGKVQDEISRAEDIIKTNAFSVTLGGRAYMALFPLVSRMNHGCRPLAMVNWDSETLTNTIKAFRDIEEGEEITVSYSDLGMLSTERLAVLRSRWGFTCSCELCSSSEEDLAASDARRKRFNELGVKVIRTLEDGDIEKAIGYHREVIQAIQEEQLTPHLGDYYEVAARLYTAVGDKKSAAKFARFAVEEYTGFGKGLEGKEDLQLLAKKAVPADES
ncbi:hypothetical protein B0T14DRAFT_557797 [Immersiella caudata]|uniref:SET domain-containing protein n=1 Tax=Immersiella caudata TaxID=314043 RepID=A0AA40BUX2_9PEZI|nr:hypothetical protein B0T14DRAFT_557797 [Immersiella caudata]